MNSMDIPSKAYVIYYVYVLLANVKVYAYVTCNYASGGRGGRAKPVSVGAGEWNTQVVSQ